MIQNPPKYKIQQSVINTETHRTDTSTLLAYDQSKNEFLFRALNSNYFVQNDDEESIKIMAMDEAEKVYESMLVRHIENIVAAFPKYHGGVGMDTYTNLYGDYD